MKRQGAIHGCARPKILRLSVELIVVMAVVVGGSVLGLSKLRDSINAELGDLSAGLGALDQTQFVAAVSSPVGDGVVERVDTIERNPVYNGEGNLVLTQWNFYRDGEIQAWRIVGNQHVYRDFERGGWVLRFVDGGLMREIRADDYRERPSMYDLEIEARNTFPKERRTGLLFERSCRDILIQ